MTSAIQEKPRAANSQSGRTEEALRVLRKTAIEMLVSEGFNNLKLTELGTRAGYSRGIVYYHFGTKKELLMDLLNQSVLRAEKTFWQQKATGLSALEKVLDSLCAVIKERPTEMLGLLLLTNEASSSPDKDLRLRLAQYNRVARKAVQRAIEEELGTINHDSGDRGITNADVVFTALMRGVCVQWLVEREAFDIVKEFQSIKSQLPVILNLPVNASSQR